MSLGPPSDNAASWTSFIFHDRLLFCKHVKSACKDSSVPVVADNEPDVPVAGPVTTFDCTDCDRKFKSEVALAGHRHRQHSVKNKFRSLVDGTICRACLTDYHTRYRIINHLSSDSKACKHFYLENPIVIDPEVCDRLDAESSHLTKTNKAAGFGPRYWHAPNIRISGPKQFNSFYDVPG